jgi:hypothetical protein
MLTLLRQLSTSTSRHCHEPASHFHVRACRSRWFWLSPHGAIKCVASENPTDLSLVEGWILARETDEGPDGFGVPGEILSLLRMRGNRVRFAAQKLGFPLLTQSAAVEWLRPDKSMEIRRIGDLFPRFQSSFYGRSWAVGVFTAALCFFCLLRSEKRSDMVHSA